MAFNLQNHVQMNNYGPTSKPRFLTIVEWHERLKSKTYTASTPTAPRKRSNTRLLMTGRNRYLIGGKFGEISRANWLGEFVQRTIHSSLSGNSHSVATSCDRWALYDELNQASDVTRLNDAPNLLERRADFGAGQCGREGVLTNGHHVLCVVHIDLKTREER